MSLEYNQKPRQLTKVKIFCYIMRFLGITIEFGMLFGVGTAVAQWLRCCATNRKVAGSIPDGVIGIFH